MTPSPVSRPSTSRTDLPPRIDSAAPAASTREPNAPTTTAAPRDVFTAEPARRGLAQPPAAPVKSASLQSLFGGAVTEQDVLSKASGAGSLSYTLQPGDTLSGIAARYGTTVDAISQANGISNPNRIFAGQTISIPTADAPSPGPSGEGATYTVQPGDTLSGIAARYGTTVDALARENGISNPNLIQVGQELRIPGAGPVTPPPPEPPPSQEATYTVQPGDTLSAIAGRFGTTVDAIAQANGISNPNLIQVGQELRIPGAGPVTPPPPVEGGDANVSLGQLRAIMPNLPEWKAQQYLPYLNQAMSEAHIDTPARKAAFLAQLAHESVELRYMEEIASGEEYEGRADLGNTQPGDGVRYKGRGPIQLTGRYNYINAGNALGIDLVNNPTRAADPDVGFRVAAWYWTTHNLNALADAGNFVGITRAINGGLNGEASREAYWARAKQVF